MSASSVNTASTPTTRTLDHLVHLSPPDTLDDVVSQYRAKGFTVIPGGTHADGLTQNALIALADGVYLELLTFTHEPSHYPLGSPERKVRDAHFWAPKHPGWIDYASLGTPASGTSPGTSDIINDRAAQAGTEVRYAKETRGGRAKPDGRKLEWVISAVEKGAGKEGNARGILPFFCGDITPRSWRIALDPASTGHANGVRGVAAVRVLASSKSDFDDLKPKLTAVLGVEPSTATSTAAYAEWQLGKLDLPEGDQAERKARLLLSVVDNEEQMEYVNVRGSGIWRLEFYGGEGADSTIVL